MASEWRNGALADIARLVMGQSPAGSTCNSSGEGLPLLNGPTEFGSHHPEPTQFTTDPKRLAQSGDLLFCVRGSTTGRMNWADQKYAIGRGIAAIRHKQEINNQPYVRAVVEYRLPSLLAEATGSTFPNVSRDQLNGLLIPIAPPAEQKAIAHILGTLDDKIELNRQMNATLEAMAQALFKSCFVDFDPVIDNALAAGNPIPEPLQPRAAARAALGDQRKPLPEAIQKQFPNRFVFNEDMGWVPEGWEIGKFGDIASHIKDNVKAEEVADFDFYVGLEHIGRKQLFLSENASGESVDSNKTKFGENDLLFGKLRPYFHKVCLSPQEGICSTDILVFRVKSSRFHSFMTLTAFREDFVEYANLRSTGTRMPRASAKDMLGFPIMIPSAPIAESFEAMTSAHWKRGMQSIEESSNLASLRDTLLPKLLSGQLRIPGAEKLIA